MLSTTLLSLLPIFGFASAATIPRQITGALDPNATYQGGFRITNFLVQLIPDFGISSYQFDLADASQGDSNLFTHCNARTLTTPVETVLYNEPCADPSVAFSLLNNGTGYVITFAHNWSLAVGGADLTDSGIGYVPGLNLVEDDTDCYTAQKLDLPNSFNVPYSRYVWGS